MFKVRRQALGYMKSVQAGPGESSKSSQLTSVLPLFFKFMLAPCFRNTVCISPRIFRQGMISAICFRKTIGTLNFKKCLDKLRPANPYNDSAEQSLGELPCPWGICGLHEYVKAVVPWSSSPQATTFTGLHSTENLAGTPSMRLWRIHCAPVDLSCLLPNTGPSDPFVLSQTSRKSKPSQASTEQLNRSRCNRCHYQGLREPSIPPILEKHMLL